MPTLDTHPYIVPPEVCLTHTIQAEAVSICATYQKKKRRKKWDQVVLTRLCHPICSPGQLRLDVEWISPSMEYSFLY